MDYGSADDGLLDEEAPDLGPLRETAEAAELAEATAGLTDDSGGALPAEDRLRPLACAVARALTEAGFTLDHCARHHPRHRLGGVCLLPVAVGHAPAEFITGPLLDNPRRVGHPLRDEYAGQHSARRGLTGACVIGSTRTATRWSSWTFLTDPTPTAHERSAPVAGN